MNFKESISSLDLDASLNDIKADFKMPVLFIKICLSIVSTYIILFHMSEEQLFYITILYHPENSAICVWCDFMYFVKVGTYDAKTV